MTNVKFKKRFTHLNFYSMPDSISIIVRKRLNVMLSFYLFLGFLLFSIL